MKETPELYSIRRWILVRTEFEGVHHWPDAPEIVSFLRHPHRHLFKLEVRFCVLHPDREMEFFIMKNEVKSYLEELRVFLIHNPEMSCEAMAEWMLLKAKNNGYYCDRVVVSEDGENDGIAELMV
jgi:hypothetical protein